MAERISPVVIGGGLLLGLAAAAVGLVALAQAAPPTPPPEGYACPYCPETFETYEELLAHIQTAHPGERIPIHIIWQ